MKKNLFKTFSAFLLLFSTACTHHQEAHQMLEDADRLVEHHADSSRKILQSLTDRSFAHNPDSKALYTLLLAQTGYVLYDSVPPDTAQSSTVRHYEAVGNNMLLCRAIYYRAMNLYVEGKHDISLGLLKWGEQKVNETSSVLYKAKYHESLCMINDKAQCKELMLKYAILFLEDAIALGDTAFIARGYSHVATAYFSMDQVGEAEKFILQTLPLLDKLPKKSKAYILTDIGCIYHRQGKLSSAKKFLEKSLGEYAMANTYAELGDIYAEEGRWADAEKSWQMALKADESIIIKNALSSIVEHYKARGDMARALDAMETLFWLSDSVVRQSEKEKIAEIQYKYDQKVTENHMQTIVNRMLVGIIAAFFLIFIGVYIHRRIVRNYSNKLDKSLKILYDAQQKLSILETERQQQTELYGRADEQYNRKIKSLEYKVEETRREIFEQVGRGKQVYEEILRNQPLLYRNDESCLVEYYSVFNFAVYSQWEAEYKGLTLRMLIFLILQDMNKSDEEICLIMNIEKVSLRSIKSRLRKLKA